MFNNHLYDHYPPSFGELSPQTLTFALDTGSQPGTGQNNQQEGRRRSSKPSRPKRYGCNLCGSHFDRPCSLRQHSRTHTGEKPHACKDCNHPFTTKSNLYRHNRTCARRLAQTSQSPVETPVISPQHFSFIYEDPSIYSRQRRRRTPEPDHGSISPSNESVDDEEQYELGYDTAGDETFTAFYEGQGEQAPIINSIRRYHSHHGLHHVPDHVRVDTDSTDSQLRQPTTPSTESSSPPPHSSSGWTTAGQLPPEASASDSYDEFTAHTPPYRGSRTTEDSTASVHHEYSIIHDDHNVNHSNLSVDHTHIGYGESHERGSVEMTLTERYYPDTSRPSGINGSARSYNEAMSHIADGQGHAGSDSTATHSYHPEHFPQPNWYDERYWGHSDEFHEPGYHVASTRHQGRWTSSTIYEYRQHAAKQYDISNVGGPHDVRYPHYA